MTETQSQTPRRALPLPTPETRAYWDGCRIGELRLQRCRDCTQAYFPPRPICPHCGSRDIFGFAASGRATLFSYVIAMRPRPDMGDQPHSIAVVALEEGPRLMTNIVGSPQTPEALVLDMALEVVFEPMSDTITLPFFRPVEQRT